ncbi:MAG TPA: 3-deoxy-D-manno-octulosonic acid transferase [Alphaproteobacteria bacterium]|nr:3-deoxy-D-manno-octulosonic acid transferase [Alphaproteobacteria bacterium]HOO49712.1 3-deoxy-D-manno-octulosonic acid transferase [Alphaproteobacteria bacterium]
MSLFWLYKKTMTIGEPLVRMILNKRVRAGKEDPKRLEERFGQASLPRPQGVLLWVHVASVGEAQSMLPMISLFLDQNPQAHAMVTTITRTAALLLEKRLPERAFHQYLPIDRPKWVRRFMDHWAPNIVLWAESELWPFIVAEIGKRRIPAALLNARMSPKSFRNWRYARGLSEKILSSFTIILTQTDQDRYYYDQLGARSVVTSDNIKYCASPLPYDAIELSDLQKAIGDRPVWVYASTHQGEEELALETHLALVNDYPDLLTIVVPRHPERSASIESTYQERRVSYGTKTKNRTPNHEHSLFVVDTLGDLGLFYALSPIACIGRSFSDDGGGGHNPLEAALLRCAVLHGPHVQNLQEIFDQMDAAQASIPLDHKDELAERLRALFASQMLRQEQIDRSYQFAESKTHILAKIIEELEPVFLLARLPLLKHPDHTKEEALG